GGPAVSVPFPTRRSSDLGAAAVVLGMAPAPRLVLARGRRGDVHLRRSGPVLADPVDDVGPVDQRRLALDGRAGPGAKPLPLTGAPGYVSGWALGVAARVSRSRIPLRPRSMARTPSSFLNPLFAP